jgi:hypothetical protein
MAIKSIDDIYLEAKGKHYRGGRHGGGSNVRVTLANNKDGKGNDTDIQFISITIQKMLRTELRMRPGDHVSLSFDTDHPYDLMITLDKQGKFSLSKAGAIRMTMYNEVFHWYERGKFESFKGQNVEILDKGTGFVRIRLPFFGLVAKQRDEQVA